MAVVLAAIIAATAAGVGAERRWGSRAQVATGHLLDGLLYSVLPFVSFFVVARLHLTTGVGVGLLYGFAAAIVAGALGWLVGSRLLRLPRESTGALMCAAMIANTGYLGLPLTATLLGSEHLGAAITYDAVVSQPMLYLAGFAVGALFGTRAGDTGSQRMRAYVVRNPVLLGLALGLVAPDWLAPEVAVSAAKAIAVGLLPVGFFVLGVNLMHEREDGAIDFPPRLTAPVASAVALRVIVAPAILLALSALAIRAPSAYKLESAMPTGINTLLVAHVYGLDLRLAAAAIAWSTTVVVTVALIVGAVS
jgi:malate permease and related proteins